MKFIIAIIQGEYINEVIEDLMDNRIRITKIASTGGFLKKGNTTLLIGTDDDGVDRIVEIIERNCKCKKQKIKSEDGEIEVQGANLFIVPMDEYVRI